MQAAHQLRAKALLQCGDGHPIPRHNFVVDQPRCVVAGVGPPDGVPHHRFSQSRVGCPHPILNRIVQSAAAEMHILAHLQKEQRHSRVLAGGDLLGLGIGRIFQQQFDDLASDGRRFSRRGCFQRGQIVGGQTVGRFGQERFDGGLDAADGNFTNHNLSSVRSG